MFDSARFTADAKQLYHLQSAGSHCELATPDERLADSIDFYWLLTITACMHQLEVIPDTAVDLALSPDIAGFAALYFPVDARFTIPLAGPIRYAGICFRSVEASRTLGGELQELRQLAQGTDTINALGIKPLVSGIQGLTSMSDVCQLFNRFWLERTSTQIQYSGQHRRLNHQKFLSVLEVSVGDSSIHSVCRSLGISERQFRRLSNELFGLSPNLVRGGP